MVLQRMHCCLDCPGTALLCTGGSLDVSTKSVNVHYHCCAPQLELLHDWEDFLTAVLIPREVQAGHMGEIDSQVLRGDRRYSESNMADVCINHCPPGPAGAPDWQKAAVWLCGLRIVPVSEQLLHHPPAIAPQGSVMRASVATAGR